MGLQVYGARTQATFLPGFFVVWYVHSKHSKVEFKFKNGPVVEMSQRSDLAGFSWIEHRLIISKIKKINR